jgi:hypothetical protein
MKSRLTATIIAFSAAVICAGANAATDITVSALSHCVDVSSSAVTGGRQTFQLAPGRYVASLLSNNMSCGGGGLLTPPCNIDTVIVRGWDGISPPGTAEWGVSVKNPTVVEVPGSAAVSFTAFVIDAPCSDNTGQSTLRLQLAN